MLDGRVCPRRDSEGVSPGSRGGSKPEVRARRVRDRRLLLLDLKLVTAGLRESVTDFKLTPRVRD
jgi:hypothetical protein